MENRFLPVVHCIDPEQAVRNVEVAKDSGAHGVFLINHSVSTSVLLHCYVEVRHAFPEMWIGMNFLGVGQRQAYSILPPTANALHCDYAGYNEGNKTSSLGCVKEFWDWFSVCREKNASKAEYFGGVAFKGNPDAEDPALAAKLCAPYMDVVTTSGIATGSAPDVEKIRTMKAALPPGKRLAIASGISIENIREFLPYCDDFLVATSIGRTFYELDPDKTRKLADIIRLAK